MRGGSLEVETRGEVILEGLPRLRVSSDGNGGGTTRLVFGDGVRIGRDVELSLWAKVDNVLEMDDRAFLMDDVRLWLHGGTVRMAPHASLRIGCIVKVHGELILGRRAGISPYGIVHCDERIEFEDFAGTAERVTIVDSDKVLDGGETDFADRPDGEPADPLRAQRLPGGERRRHGGLARRRGGGRRRRGRPHRQGVPGGLGHRRDPGQAVAPLPAAAEEPAGVAG